MDIHHHSEESEKIDINLEHINFEELNYLEQLGLYLVGYISRGKLCELWKSGFLTASDIVNGVYDGIKDFIK